MKWVVLKHYRFGPRVFEPGQVVEVEEAWARAINEDEPGTMRPADSADVVEDRAVEKPVEDRMVKGKSKRVEAEVKKPETGFGATKSGRKY